MRIATTATLLAILLALSLLSASAQEEIREIAVEAGGSREVSGQLRGPENSGETHLYKVNTGPGLRVEVEFTLRHVEFVGSRISTAILSPSGGRYVGADDLLAQGAVKRFFYSWLTGSEGPGSVIIAVSSLADRLAPSVVNYTIKVSLLPQRDGEEVKYEAEARSEKIDLGIGDAPSTIQDAAPMASRLALVESGGRMQLSGYLSSSYSESAAGIKKVYGGNDYEDYYAVRVKTEPGSTLEVSATPHKPVRLSLSLQMKDGFTLNASASPSEGAPAATSIRFTKEEAEQVLYLRVGLLGGSAPEAPYDLVLSLRPPIRITPIEEREPPIMPGGQARMIVMGVAAAILAVTAGSAVVGRARRRRAESSWGWGY